MQKIWDLLTSQNIVNTNTNNKNKMSDNVEEEEEDAECIDLAEETYDIIRTIQDPEKALTLEDLEVVAENLVKVKKLKNGTTFHINIEFVPTVPHCTLASLIGLSIRAKLEENLVCNYKLDINIKEGTHDEGPQITKQINDKERTAAAMENPDVVKLVQGCILENG